MSVVDFGEFRIVREYGEFLQLLKCLELAGRQLIKNYEALEWPNNLDEEDMSVVRESNRFFNDVLLTCGSELQRKMNGNGRQLMSLLSADCLTALRNVMAARKRAVETDLLGQRHDYPNLAARAEEAADLILQHIEDTRGASHCNAAGEEQARLMQLTAAACPFWMEFIAPAYRTAYAVRPLSSAVVETGCAYHRAALSFGRSEGQGHLVPSVSLLLSQSQLACRHSAPDLIELGDLDINPL